MTLKRAGMITKIVVFALIIYAAASLISLRSQIDAAAAEQDALKRQVVEKELSNAEREYEIENSGDDDVIAGIARDMFGLVRSGERVFYDTED